MLWRDRRESSNFEDRRGSGGGFGGGGGGFRIPIGSGRGPRRSGIGIGALLVILLIAWALGINPLTLLDGGDGSLPVPTEQAGPNGSQPGASQPGAPQQGSAAQDEMSRFVRVVLADTEDTWNGLFDQNGANYPEPTLVLFNGAARSACGFASAASGPFYCPNDRKIYIDLGFYEDLRRRFQAPGDFAQAYVIAHEVGHHVQNLLGILGKYAQARQAAGEAEGNAMSVRVELQADCFAGIWGRDASDKGLLEAGDLEEALNAAAKIGDDAIQRRNQGYVVPESFNHGTSEQRARWFKRGFDAKSVQACDTFGARTL